MKGVILFDIDYTIFNTDIFRNEVDNDIFPLISVEKSAYTKVKNDYISSLKKSTDFSPYSLASKLSNTFHYPQNKFLTKYIDNIALYKRCVYPGTIESLTNLKKKYRLGIFSEGRKYFQYAKLKNTGLLPHFDNDLIFIFKRKLTTQSLKKLPSKSIVVDDNPKVVEKLKSTEGFTPLLINRLSDPKLDFNKELSLLLKF